MRRRAVTIHIRGGVLAALGLATLLLAAGCAPAGTTIEGDVVIGVPEADDLAALFATVRGGAEGDWLDSVTVAGAGRTALHRTEQVDGRVQMIEVPSAFGVPEDGLLELRPGGDHVMLQQLERAFVAGDSVPVTLHLRSGDVRARARVVPLSELDAALAVPGTRP